jgi:uncharacterized membrane protein
MIVGIVSIPALCLCGLGLLSGIVAVVLGFLGRQKAERGEATNAGQALAGIITGGVAVLLGILWIVFTVILGVFDIGMQPDF